MADLPKRPHCWTDPFDFHPAKLEPRTGCDWCHDQGAACRAYDPDRASARHFPAECDGCARKVRAMGIHGGVIAPHPHRTGRVGTIVPAASESTGCGLSGGQLPT